MKEPILNLSLPLTVVNTVLNALGQGIANGNLAQGLINAQSQAQLNPQPPAAVVPAGAANDNVIPIGGPESA